MTERLIQIAIDGPAGAGKSTVAKLLAEKLDILYLDTGAMYRAFTFFCRSQGIGHDLSDEKVLELFGRFGLEMLPGKVVLNGEDITSAIRTKDIDLNVSGFAANALIRKKMVELQQAIAGRNSIVMEGRDICDVVLPDAEFKYYLDASVEERAKRRCLQNEQKGVHEEMEAVMADIIRRDTIDSTREADPLSISADAVVLDTSGMSVDEVIDTIIARVRRSV